MLCNLAFPLLFSALSDPAVSNLFHMAPDRDFEHPKMDQRRQIPPGLPRANPIQSYWQDPPDEIADCRTTPNLLHEADVVIIGSGVSGSCIAYNVLSSDPGLEVVMLEARQAASGASGRNGRWAS